MKKFLTKIWVYMPEFRPKYKAIASLVFLLKVSGCKGFDYFDLYKWRLKIIGGFSK